MVGQRSPASVPVYNILQTVEGVRNTLYYHNSQFLTEGGDVVISNSAKWLWIFLESEWGGTPLLEKLW